MRASFERLCNIRPPGASSLPGGETLARLGELDDWLRTLTPSSLGADVHEPLTHVVDEIAKICNGISRELIGFAPAQPSSQSQ